MVHSVRICGIRRSSARSSNLNLTNLDLEDPFSPSVPASSASRCARRWRRSSSGRASDGLAFDPQRWVPSELLPFLQRHQVLAAAHNHTAPVSARSCLAGLTASESRALTCLSCDKRSAGADAEQCGAQHVPRLLLFELPPHFFFLLPSLLLRGQKYSGLEATA